MLPNGIFDPLAMGVHDFTTYIDDENAAQDFVAGIIITIAADAENLCNIWDMDGKYEEVNCEQYKIAC